MAKQNLSPGQEKIVKRYYENKETIHVNNLSAIVSDLWLAEDQKTKTRLWGRAQTALMRMGVNANRAAKVVGSGDVEQLAALVKELDAGGGTQPQDKPEEKAMNARSVADGRTVGQMRSEKAAEGGYDSLEEANLKRALRAFRRKLKTLRREDESKLGGRQLTGGKVSGITAITPPTEYPMDVWLKLVELNRLKKGGSGTFELP